MRIGVISDSHGNIQALKAALDAAGRVDAWLHAGDYFRDSQWLAVNTGLPVYSVCGNCDFSKEGPLERVVELAGARILLSHGHHYQVKYNLMRLALRALELECGAAVFGHTHVPTLERYGSVTLLNPGSAAEPRLGSRRGIAVMEIRDGIIDVKMIPLK
ncbi:MAG: metallophosphoesterase [Bacillota bacterium]